MNSILHSMTFTCTMSIYLFCKTVILLTFHVNVFVCRQKCRNKKSLKLFFNIPYIRMNYLKKETKSLTFLLTFLPLVLLNKCNRNMRNVNRACCFQRSCKNSATQQQQNKINDNQYRKHNHNHAHRV